MLLESLLICLKMLETAKSNSGRNQRNRDFFSKYQKIFEPICDEIVNGSALTKKDKEVARLFYHHDKEYTWEMAFSQVYIEYADLDDIKKLVANCKKRIQRAINEYTNEYIEKTF